MKIIWRALLTLVVVITPVFLLLPSIRGLFNPGLLSIEYRMPGFPEDSYGFTQEERLKWAKPSVEYLLNDADISFLENLKFEDGQPIYTERELSHMKDVKTLLQYVIPIWIILSIFLLLVGVLAWRSNKMTDFGHSLSTGGWTTLGLVAAIAIGVGLSFSSLFSSFHRIFFEGDSWLFYTSDTLIRLFPMRLWRDAFLFVGAITIIEAFLLIAFGRFLARRKIPNNP